MSFVREITICIPWEKPQTPGRNLVLVPGNNKNFWIVEIDFPWLCKNHWKEDCRYTCEILHKKPFQWNNVFIDSRSAKYKELNFFKLIKTIIRRSHFLSLHQTSQVSPWDIKDSFIQTKKSVQAACQQLLTTNSEQCLRGPPVWC